MVVNRNAICLHGMVLIGEKCIKDLLNPPFELSTK